MEQLNSSQPDRPACQVLFIGGASGVGKTTVAAEISRVLGENGVKHAAIEGDFLDMAFPEPWREGIQMAELNLAAVWQNFSNFGYRRLIYTNTVSILERSKLLGVLGEGSTGLAVLLEAENEFIAERLAVRDVAEEITRATGWLNVEPLN